MPYRQPSIGLIPFSGKYSRILDYWERIYKKNRVENDPELPNLTAYEDYNTLNSFIF